MSWAKAEAELLKRKITVVMREDAQKEALAVAEALTKGGITSFEITFESKHAAAALKTLKEKQYFAGAGTVRTLDDAEAALKAGADFIFCPHFAPELVRFGREQDLLVIPGIFTPSELAAAYQAGATVVKLFPASTGDPGHLKALRGPFPELRCIPTGGISADNLGEYIRAGAVGVGLGGGLVSKAAISGKRWEALTEEAAKVVAAAKSAGWTL